MVEEGPTADGAGQTYRWTTRVRLVRDDKVWRAAVACWSCFWAVGDARKTITSAEWDGLYPVVHSDQLPPVVSDLLNLEARDPKNYPWPLSDPPSSTKIFRLLIDEEVEGLAFADAAFQLAFFRKLQLSRPMGEDWTSQRILIEREREHHRGRLNRSDFPSGTAPAFSRRATDGLRDLLVTCGEFLPTICDEGEYFFFNVTTVCDILDEERSRIHRSRGTVLDIHRHVFKKNATLKPANVMFKLPCRPSGSAVYVTDRFVERVQALGLIGLRVDQVGAID